MRDKIYISGGHGFIGSHLVKRMVDLGYSVTHLYDVKDHVDNDGTIIHLAARHACMPEFQMIESNISFTSALFNAHRSKRILYMSTAQINDATPYAMTKRHNEWLAKKLNLNATGFRLHNVYGVGNKGIIGRIINAIMNDGELTINGGNQQRDFVYVDDVVNTIIENLHSTEKIIEVGTGRVTSLAKVIDIVEQVTAKELKVKYIPLGKDKEYMICPTPLHKFTNIQAGITKTIEAWSA